MNPEEILPGQLVVYMEGAPDVPDSDDEEWFTLSGITENFVIIPIEELAKLVACLPGYRDYAIVPKNLES